MESSCCRVSSARVLSRYEDNHGQQSQDSLSARTLETGRFVRRTIETITSIAEASLTME